MYVASLKKHWEWLEFARRPLPIFKTRATRGQKTRFQRKKNSITHRMLVYRNTLGRILRILPQFTWNDNMCQLETNKAKIKQNSFSLEAFFHFGSLTTEHHGVENMSMEEFLEMEALSGNLRNKTTGVVSSPPDNQTNWDSRSVANLLCSGHGYEMSQRFQNSICESVLWEYPRHLVKKGLI